MAFAPRTGRTASALCEFDTVEIFRVGGDKLIEHWDVADRLALQTGLGLVAPVK